MKSTYRLQLIASFAIPWVAIVLFMLIYFPWAQKSSSQAAAERQVRTLTDMLAYSVGAGLIETNLELVQMAYQWAKQDTSVVYLAILDEQQFTIVEYNPQMRPSSLASLVKSHGVSSDENGLVSVSPVVVNNQRLGTVVLVYSLEAVNATIRQRQLVSVIVSSLAFAIGLWGSLLLSRQSAELARSNARLAESNAELKEAQAELQVAHGELELRVADRTAKLASMNQALENEIAVRARVEESLKEHEERLTMAMTGADMGTWDVNLVNGEVTWGYGTEKLFGLPPGTFGGTQEAFFKCIHPGDQEAVKSHSDMAVRTGAYFDTDFRVVWPDGTTRWLAAFGKCIEDAGGRPWRLAGVNKDITERKLAEERLRMSLNEKEVLLKEIHHRVKNNLQVVSSLLYLQSRDIKDAQVLEMFVESQNRVKSMALVHEKLYQAKDLARIDFKDYVRNLAKSLISTIGSRDSRVSLQLNLNEVFLSIEAAVPCGLLINEIITNSLKHAFPGDMRGTLTIGLSINAEQLVTLSLSDDGVGLPANVEIGKTTTLGLRLVHILTQQLGGSVQIAREGGTHFTVTFTDNKQS